MYATRPWKKKLPGSVSFNWILKYYYAMSFKRKDSVYIEMRSPKRTHFVYIYEFIYNLIFTLCQTNVRKRHSDYVEENVCELYSKLNVMLLYHNNLYLFFIWFVELTLSANHKCMDSLCCNLEKALDILSCYYFIKF